MRTARERKGTAGPLAKVRADDPAEVSAAGAFDRPRDDPGGRARPHVPGPGHRRAAGGRREAAAAGAVAVEPPVGRGEPALLQLVRPTRPEGPERLPNLQ